MGDFGQRGTPLPSEHGARLGGVPTGEYGARARIQAPGVVDFGAFSPPRFPFQKTTELSRTLDFVGADAENPPGLDEGGLELALPFLSRRGLGI